MKTSDFCHVPDFVSPRTTLGEIHFEFNVRSKTNLVRNLTHKMPNMKIPGFGPSSTIIYSSESMSSRAAALPRMLTGPLAHPP